MESRDEEPGWRAGMESWDGELEWRPGIESWDEKLEMRNNGDRVENLDGRFSMDDYFAKNFGS